MDLGCLVFNVYGSHTIRRTYPVWLLWKSDQLVAKAAKYTSNARHNHSPTIPTIKRLQTYALERTATGMGPHFLTKQKQSNNDNINVLQELKSIELDSMPHYCQFSTQQKLVPETLRHILSVYLYRVRQSTGRFCNTFFSGSAALERMPLSPFCCQL